MHPNRIHSGASKPSPVVSPTIAKVLSDTARRRLQHACVRGRSAARHAADRGVRTLRLVWQTAWQGLPTLMGVV